MQFAQLSHVIWMLYLFPCGARAHGWRMWFLRSFSWAHPATSTPWPPGCWDGLGPHAQPGTGRQSWYDLSTTC